MIGIKHKISARPVAGKNISPCQPGGLFKQTNVPCRVSPFWLDAVAYP
jgi:hypothetical protein